MSRHDSRTTWLTAVGTCTLLAGCAKELTRDHFDLIEVNVADNDLVEDLIGEPDSKGDRQWVYEDDELTVLIDFDDDDVVTRKQWHDPENSEHYDSDKGVGSDGYQESP